MVTFQLSLEQLRKLAKERVRERRAAGEWSSPGLKDT